MRGLLLVTAFVVGTAPVCAGDWPQWLGPRRDGSSNESVSPWREAPKVLWRRHVGEGHSSPIVAHGLVFLHDQVPNQEVERITAWKAADGQEVSTISRPRTPFKNPFGNGPRATPVYSAGMLVSLGVTGELCRSDVDAAGQVKLRYQKNLLKEFDAKNLFFGMSASLLVANDLIVAMAGGKGAGIVALAATDGKVVWKATDDPASYAAPILMSVGDQRHVVCLTQKGLIALALKDGAVQWSFPFQDRLSESSTTPVVVGDRLIASSVTLGSVCLRVASKDGKVSVEEVWKNGDLSCYFSTPVAHGSHLFMVTAGGNLLQPKLNLRCVETATGKIIWSKADVGRYHAALLKTANDKLLMLDDRGYLTLLQPDAKGYAELARSKVCGQTWAHPALVNGRLFLRDDKELLCIELPK